MTCLEELGQKISRIIQKNKELQDQINDLSLAKMELEDKILQFEASLLKEMDASSVLNQEKVAIKNTIEELLSTIDTLENAL